MKLWKLMVVKCHFSEKWWNLAMAFQWRPIASHTQVRLEGFPYQTQTLNRQVRLQLTIEFYFCWSQLRSDSPNPETPASLNPINCGKLIVFHVAKYMISTNWTEQDRIWPYWNPPFQIIWDLLFKFHRPGSVLRWQVQIIGLPAESVGTQKKQAYGLVQKLFVHILYLSKKVAQVSTGNPCHFNVLVLSVLWWQGA